MAVDIRATVTCSLGTLISGSISDDYIQNSGLIKTKGECEIKGLLTPSIGTIVTFSFTKNGLTRRVPRQLVVLSSFADPFRRTTKVELGCMLSYMSDLKEPVKWQWYDDQANQERPIEDAKIVTIPIHASSVMDKCLTEIGITASENPLTNKFSVAEFDFGSGYVNVLSDLLVSESYCGYMDASGVLQVFSLDQEGGTGPVLDNKSLIDVGPIGVGQLPGDAVTVSYSTMKLKYKDGDEIGSDTDPEYVLSTTTSKSEILLAYTGANGAQETIKYPNLEETQVASFYKEILTKKGDVVNVLDKRITYAYCNAASIVGQVAVAYLNEGIEFPNERTLLYSEEFFTYDENGEEIKSELLKVGSVAHAIGEIPLPVVFSPTDYLEIRWDNAYRLEAVKKYYTRNGDFVETKTETYGSWLRTIAGQQALAESRESFTTADEVDEYLYEILKELRLLNVTEEVTATRYRGQRGPRRADQIAQQHAAETGDPNNGYRTESTVQLALASGSATAQRRIEFNMPYAPDDIFEKQGDKFIARTSDAEAKAKTFGLVQNRLLMGNRNGMNLQTAPDALPSTPFAPFFVIGNGFAALYRTNALSWTMDSSGVVTSTDGVYWGIAGKAS